MGRRPKRIRSKKTDDDSSNVIKYNSDVLSEILIRIDPSNIFSCLLVSKNWLSVITAPVFRTNYLKKWSNLTSSFKVVGFLVINEPPHMKQKDTPGVSLIATSRLGQIINERTLTKPELSFERIGHFVSKSQKGGLLLFNRQKKWYVCKLFAGIHEPPVELPQPPTYYEKAAGAIECDDDDGADYNVILARQMLLTDFDDDDHANVINIQTYCSRTTKWEQSTRPIIQDTNGIVDAGCVMYWRNVFEEEEDVKTNRLVLRNLSGSCIRVAPAPPFREAGKRYLSVAYGVSPQGSLVAARFNNDSHSLVSEKFAVWALSDGKKNWRFLYSVSHAVIWARNLQLLTTLFNFKPKRGFTFVSFVPGKSDSVFLMYGKHLFVYHFNTHELEPVKLKYGLPLIQKLIHSTSTYFNPLTVIDLGIWPTSPTCL